MSEVKGKIGDFELTWTSIPHGAEGNTQVRIGSEAQPTDVSWRKDAHGIWIETPTGLYGFDIAGSRDDDGKIVFSASQRGTANQWENLSFLRAGEEQLATAGAGKKKGVRVRAQMPGKIIRIMVKAGDQVERDQPLLVMEAMKMENEIRAQAAGEVKEVKVTEGQAVETGADLVKLE